MADANTQTARTTVKRIPKRGSYDSETINAILDEALICQVGFNISGQPYVIPTRFERVCDDLYIHGSAASRMLRNLAGGEDYTMNVWAGVLPFALEPGQPVSDPKLNQSIQVPDHLRSYNRG